MSARLPLMCWLPLAKRQPGQRLHRTDVAYGQSNFDRIGRGTTTSIPPTLSIRSRNSRKFTMITWLTGMSVYEATVRIASRGPPTWNAVLIFDSP